MSGTVHLPTISSANQKHPSSSKTGSVKHATNNRIAQGNHVNSRPRRQRDSFPAPKQNGHVVSGEVTHHQGETTGQHYTYYHNEARSKVRAEAPPRPSKRREQSLPTRKPQEDESPRKSNSAPSKKGGKPPPASLPKINTMMAKIRSQERDHTYGRHWGNEHAGVSTKDQDAQNHRSQRFTSTWAGARTEHNRDDTNRAEQSKPQKKHEHSKSENHKKSGEKTSEPHSEKEHIRRKNERTLNHMFSDDKENTPNNRNDPRKYKTHSPREPRKAKTHSPKSPRDYHRKNKVHSPRDRNDSRNKNLSPRDSNKSPNLSLKLKEKKSAPKGDWNPSYVLEKPAVASRRQQEHELTHHPAITDTNDVYKAYVGLTKRELRRGPDDNSSRRHQDDNVSRRHQDDTVSRVFSQYGDVYHATLSVSPRNRKEYVLTLREADTYRKINSVYGEDSVRRKRKSVLLEKLVTVELDQLKQHRLSQRERERKRDESRRRQQRQLYVIRRRFKQQQSRRFRSQYVTSRVLEHEKMTRNNYGLPEEDAAESDSQNSRNQEETTVEGSQTSHSNRKEDSVKMFDKRERKKQYEKKYKNMFDFKVGPTWNPRDTTPKMEGVDIVTVEVKDKEGNVKERKTDVKDVVKDAKKLLKQKTREYDDPATTTTTSTTTPRSRSRRRPSLDSLEFDEDDDDDIFERARRKYHLDVDSVS